jgi:hypothetical protein
VLVFHIGYHKTASTWLRRAVFPCWQDVAFQPRNSGIVAAWVRHLIDAPDAEFLARAMKATLEECEERSGRPVVISNEDLSGALFGGDRSGFRHGERLRDVAPQARVLVVIRRQQDMARSLHGQYINLGGYRPLTDFLSGPVEGAHFRAEHLAYDALLEHYIALFGASRVSVVPYELLTLDPPQFLRAVAQACGSQGESLHQDGQENVSLSRYSMAILRGWNRAFRRTELNPAPLLRALPGASWPRYVLQQRVEPRLPRFVRRRHMTAGQRAFLSQFTMQFAVSNARTERLAGYDLAALGYVVSHGREAGSYPIRRT